MTDDTTNQPHKLARLIGLALAVALTLGACGSTATSDNASAELPTLSTGQDDSSDGESDTDDEAEEEDSDISEEDAAGAQAQFEQCMSDNGVSAQIFASEGGDGADIDSLEVPEDDEPKTGDVDPEAFEAAMDECESILNDAFGEFEMSPEQEAELADQMLEMQKCMTDKGFDFDLEDQGTIDVDETTNFEAFDAALQDCMPEGTFDDAGADQ